LSAIADGRIVSKESFLMAVDRRNAARAGPAEPPFSFGAARPTERVQALRRYHVNCYGLPPEFVQVIRMEVRRYRRGVSPEELDAVVRRLAQRLPFLTQ
jgi:hypothetical protein